VAKGKLTKTITGTVKKELYLAKQRKAHEERLRRAKILRLRVAQGEALSAKERAKLSPEHRRLYARLLERQVARQMEVSDAQKQLSRFRRYVLGETGAQIVANRDRVIRKIGSGEVEHEELSEEMRKTIESWPVSRRKQYYAAIARGGRKAKIEEHRRAYVRDTQTLFDSLVRGKTPEVRYQRLKQILTNSYRIDAQKARERTRRRRIQSWHDQYQNSQSEFED
jgi:hypothetical protein